MIVRRLVKIVHRTPGGPIPEDCDFYWSMEHDQRYNTFVDSFTEEPPTKAQFAKAKGPRVSIYSSHSRVIRSWLRSAHTIAPVGSCSTDCADGISMHSSSVLPVGY